MKDYFVPTENFFPTQPNPTEKLKSKKGDCVIRAFALSANIDWLQAFDLLVENARKTYNAPNDNINVHQTLLAYGYEYTAVKAEKGKKRLDVKTFCEKNPKGRFYLVVANHHTAIVDGIIRDTWNTSECCIYRIYRLKK